MDNDARRLAQARAQVQAQYSDDKARWEATVKAAVHAGASCSTTRDERTGGVTVTLSDVPEGFAGELVKVWFTRIHVLSSTWVCTGPPTRQLAVRRDDRRKMLRIR